jgi:hypothetical protein
MGLSGAEVKSGRLVLPHSPRLFSFRWRFLFDFVLLDAFFSPHPIHSSRHFFFEVSFLASFFKRCFFKAGGSRLLDSGCIFSPDYTGTYSDTLAACFLLLLHSDL